MRLKEIRGLPVIDPTAARKIGTVMDYQIDPGSGRIAAFDITPVSGGESQRVMAQRIRRVGSSAVILTARGGSQPNAPTEVVDRWLDTSTTVGLDVMGDDGNRIGQLMDATFDQDSLAIEAYLLRASFTERLVGRRGRIHPDTVHACSRELMMVTTGRVTATATELVHEDTPVPLKDADRLASPSFDQVQDGKAVGITR